jgi:hypothetical protein
MLQFLAGSFLILHGLVHAMYLAPKPGDPSYPFVPERTWFATTAHLDTGAAKAIFATLAMTALMTFLLAGIGVFASAGWWQAFAVVGAVTSLATLLLGFHPRLVFGVTIDVAILASVLWAHVPAALYE